MVTPNVNEAISKSVAIYEYQNSYINAKRNGTKVITKKASVALKTSLLNNHLNQQQ